MLGTKCMVKSWKGIGEVIGTFETIREAYGVSFDMSSWDAGEVTEASRFALFRKPLIGAAAFCQLQTTSHDDVCVFSSSPTKKVQLHSFRNVMLRKTRVDSIEIKPTTLKHLYRCMDPDKVSFEPVILVLLETDMAGRICFFEVTEKGLHPFPKHIVVDVTICSKILPCSVHRRLPTEV